MAEAIKSALLVDCESLQRSLAGAAGINDARLAERASAWIAAIETGRLIGPEGTRRRLLVRRCYAGPDVRGKQRDALAEAGFVVVDVDGTGRSSADLHMAMDTIDALSQPNGPDEFILLTAAAELAPLLTRLKASKRQTTIYADASTAQRDRSLADATLESADLAAFLASDETPVSEPKGGASDRTEIEAFARRIHSATNIPLFSPKTFAELFKHLTDEIRENGYHFQTTAKNVADRMTATGRSVTRRQVVFIVKGLALKGHVFSMTDTPDGLAEVFREQARYLITNAGITLDARQDQLLAAWFVSRPPEPAEPPKAKGEAPRPARKQPEQATPPARQPAATKAPPVSVRPPPVKPVELPKSLAKPSPARPAPLPSAREEAKAVIEARIAASAKMKPSTRPGSPAKAGPKAPAPPPAKQQPSKREPNPASAALESSILAAIAEAVDVLVEDGSEDERPSREPPAKKKQNNNAARPEETATGAPPIADSDDAESSDIGDQIQRIIASYNRNRGDE